jgi:hypothetical protein
MRRITAVLIQKDLAILPDSTLAFRWGLITTIAMAIQVFYVSYRVAFSLDYSCENCLERSHIRSLIGYSSSDSDICVYVFELYGRPRDDCRHLDALSYGHHPSNV